ncbi:MAG TPA: hypothetical protein P5531_10505 [Bacteroidales bacterium]|nr:hypothetical protein [Bacteroidales bacterium]HSA43607.1 hypothetical protein [Bacteroidales bacterium]
MAGTTTLINLRLGMNIVMPGNNAGDVLVWNGDNWGPTVVMLPYNFLALNVTENVEYEHAIPQHHLIKTISVRNTTANPVQVAIDAMNDLGELFNETIEGNSIITLTVNIALNTDQIVGLAISSADWNDASVDISINTEKLFS